MVMLVPFGFRKSEDKFQRFTECRVVFEKTSEPKWHEKTSESKWHKRDTCQACARRVPAPFARYAANISQIFAKGPLYDTYALLVTSHRITFSGSHFRESPQPYGRDPFVQAAPLAAAQLCATS
jgi:hypothetical protein